MKNKKRINQKIQNKRNRRKKESVRNKSRVTITPPLLRSISDFPDTPMGMGLEINGKNEWIQDGVDHREEILEVYHESRIETNRFQNNWERFFSYHQDVFNKTREELIEEKITSMGLNDTISELVEVMGETCPEVIFDTDEEETPREFVLKLSLMTDPEWSRGFNNMMETFPTG